MSPLVAVLLEFLIGAGLAWLRELLKKSKADPSLTGDPEAAIRAAFLAARQQMSWWDEYVKRRGRALARAERIALKHAAALVATARGEGPPVVMSSKEYAECCEE